MTKHLNPSHIVHGHHVYDSYDLDPTSYCTLVQQCRPSSSSYQDVFEGQTPLLHIKHGSNHAGPYLLRII